MVLKGRKFKNIAPPSGNGFYYVIPLQKIEKQENKQAERYKLIFTLFYF
jgi:hypothetical protein